MYLLPDGDQEMIRVEPSLPQVNLALRTELIPPASFYNRFFWYLMTVSFNSTFLMKDNVGVKMGIRVHWYHNWLKTYQLNIIWIKILSVFIVSSISEEYNLPVNYTINYLTIGFSPEFHRFWLPRESAERWQGRNLEKGWPRRAEVCTCQSEQISSRTMVLV